MEIGKSAEFVGARGETCDWEAAAGMPAGDQVEMDELRHFVSEAESKSGRPGQRRLGDAVEVITLEVKKTAGLW